MEKKIISSHFFLFIGSCHQSPFPKWMLINKFSLYQILSVVSNLLRKLSDIRDVVRLKLNADEGEFASICVVLIRSFFFYFFDGVLIRSLKYVNLKLLICKFYFLLFIIFPLFSLRKSDSSDWVVTCELFGLWSLDQPWGNVGRVNCVTKLGYDWQ